MKDLVKKLFNYINKIGQIRGDLIIHCGISALILIILFNVIVLCATPAIALMWAIFITSMIGVGKEYIIDKVLRESYADKKDLMADFVGICIGTVCELPLLFL